MLILARNGSSARPCAVTWQVLSLFPSSASALPFPAPDFAARLRGSDFAPRGCSCVLESSQVLGRLQRRAEAVRAELPGRELGPEDDVHGGCEEQLRSVCVRVDVCEFLRVCAR
eukprot:472289-Rhodomonas_salina.1